MAGHRPFGVHFQMPHHCGAISRPRDANRSSVTRTAIAFDLVAADLAVDRSQVHPGFSEADPELIPVQCAGLRAMFQAQLAPHRLAYLEMSHTSRLEPVLLIRIRPGRS